MVNVVPSLEVAASPGGLIWRFMNMQAAGFELTAQFYCQGPGVVRWCDRPAGDGGFFREPIYG
jgi:hypothetical protein